MEEKKKKGRMVALGSRPSCGKSLSCGSACEQGTEPLTFDLPVKQGGGTERRQRIFSCGRTAPTIAKIINEKNSLLRSNSMA